MIGRKSGRLTVIDRATNNVYGQARWVCRCECGNICIIKGNNLRTTRTKSCGCLRKETVNKNRQKQNHTGPRNPYWNGGNRIVFCDNCQRAVERTPYRVRVNKHFFCNRKCLGAWQSKHQRGSNNSRWKGGISKEPYCHIWNTAFKNEIRERDNNICQFCGATKNCLGNKEIAMAVHHVDYNKKNCGSENLITLCTLCNSRANKNRDWWGSWFKAKMLHNYTLRCRRSTSNHENTINYTPGH